MSDQGTFTYIVSNGRCGTQFLARRLAEHADTQNVIHERVGRELRSRHVLRDREARFRQIGREPLVQRLFLNIENTLRKGRDFIFFGWQAYGYVDYFQDRFGPQFRFMHLVRNPYLNAMSHGTHHPMIAPGLNAAQLAQKIFGGDPSVTYRELAKGYEQFNTLERQLFHWLEQTRFLQEQNSLSGYRGVLRFEDLMNPEKEDLNAFAGDLLGHDVTLDNTAPFDRIHGPYRGVGGVGIAPELIKEVDALARTLGYSDVELEAARQPDALLAKYSTKRYDLPLDPSLPVVKRKPRNA